MVMEKHNKDEIKHIFKVKINKKALLDSYLLYVCDGLVSVDGLVPENEVEGVLTSGDFSPGRGLIQ